MPGNVNQDLSSIILLMLLAMNFAGGCAWTSGMRETVLDPDKDNRQRKHELKMHISDRQQHARLKAAYAHLESRDYARCHQMLDEASKIDPTDKNVALVRAEVFLAESRFAMAADVYQRLINQDPDDASLHHLRAVALELSGDTEAAQLAFQEAARLSPGSAVIQMSQLAPRDSGMR